MLVKYIKHTENVKYKNEDLVGVHFAVLSIEFNTKGEADKLLIDKGTATPVLFDIECFDIVDSKIPQNWTFRIANCGSVFLEPQEFIGDFWDNYYNEDDDAQEILMKIKKEMKTFHGLD